MPAAENKTDLLTVHHKEFAKLEKKLAAVGPDVALAKDDEDTSIKDVIAHRAHWIGLFLGWYTEGMAGKEVFFPAPGYKWNALKQYNRDLRAKQMDMAWDDAVAALNWTSTNGLETAAGQPAGSPTQGGSARARRFAAPPSAR